MAKTRLKSMKIHIKDMIQKRGWLWKRCRKDSPKVELIDAFTYGGNRPILRENYLQEHPSSSKRSIAESIEQRDEGTVRRCLWFLIHGKRRATKPVIIEPTSGNRKIWRCNIAAMKRKGYRAILLTMPETMSTTEAYGNLQRAWICRDMYTADSRKEDEENVAKAEKARTESPDPKLSSRAVLIIN